MGEVLRSVDEHRQAILDDLEPMAAGPAAAARGAGPRLRRGRGGADLAAGLRQLGDGRVRRQVRRRRAAAGPETPVTLPVVGEIGAGQARLRALGPGAAAKIMTGAPVPAGADAVVPYEWTDRGADSVRIEQAPELRPAHPGGRRRRRRGRPARPARATSSARAGSACSPPSAGPRSSPGPGRGW